MDTTSYVIFVETMMSKEPCTYCEGWGNLPHLVHNNFEEHMACPYCKGRGYFYNDDDVTWADDDEVVESIDKMMKLHEKSLAVLVDDTCSHYATYCQCGAEVEQCPCLAKYKEYKIINSCKNCNEQYQS